MHWTSRVPGAHKLSVPNSVFSTGQPNSCRPPSLLPPSHKTPYSHHFKVAFSIFIMLCGHHRYLIPKYSLPLDWKLDAGSQVVRHHSRMSSPPGLCLSWTFSVDTVLHYVVSVCDCPHGSVLLRFVCPQGMVVSPSLYGSTLAFVYLFTTDAVSCPERHSSVRTPL